MKYNTLFVVVLFNILPSNAVSSDLSIKANLVSNYCSEYFGMINATFENNSSKWIEISSIDVSFGSHDVDKKIHLVTGDKLVSWRDAIKLKSERDAFYTRVILGAIAVAGATSSKGDANISSTVALGATGALTIYEISDAKTKINLGPVVPRTHLFAGKILIPPGLWVSRWAVFNTDPDNNIPLIENVRIKAEFRGQYTY